MAITPLVKVVTSIGSDLATDIQTVLTATTVTHIYGISSFRQGSKVITVICYD